MKFCFRCLQALSCWSKSFWIKGEEIAVMFDMSQTWLWIRETTVGLVYGILFKKVLLLCLQYGKTFLSICDLHSRELWHQHLKSAIEVYAYFSDQWNLQVVFLVRLTET